MSHGTALTRFFAKVAPPASPEDCWEWTGYRNDAGYPIFVVANGVRVRAHRFAHETFNGPIADGFQVDHLCHDPHVCHLTDDCPHRGCVNPAHLAAVTPRENVMRTDGFAPQKAAQTHCIHGHEFNAANTRIRKNGSRNCRECARANVRAWKARRRARLSA